VDRQNDTYGHSIHKIHFKAVTEAKI